MNKKLRLILLITSLIISCNRIEKLEPVNDELEFPEIDETQIIKSYTASIIATGDNLFHETIIRDYKVDNDYDFSPIYTEIKNMMKKADIAIINQETVMAGAQYGYSGFPRFNTPQDLAKTIADTGFDIVNHANNHAMDMGASGLYKTLELWDTIQGITVIGARKSGESARIITKNNITFGILSYTHSLNGIPLPDDNQNLVSLNYKKTMKSEIAALRPLCDFLIVCMHWGEEYMLIEPVQSQIDLAAFLAEQNVDVIIGHHPHVIQRTEKIKRPDGNECLCYYSLGNFVSNQIEKDRILGGIMCLSVEKKIGENINEVFISDHGMIPVVCHFETGYTNTKVYPLYSYNDYFTYIHRLKRNDEDLTMDYFYSVLKKLNGTIIMHEPF